MCSLASLKAPEVHSGLALNLHYLHQAIEYMLGCMLDYLAGLGLTCHALE